MISEQTKLYIQLAPSASGSDELLQLQERLQLGNDSAPVKRNVLHLTVLHFGLIERALTTIRPTSRLNEQELMAAVTTLHEDLQMIADTTRFATVPLQPVGLDGYGQNKTTLVVTFAVTKQLDELHKLSLTALKNYLRNSGITDVNNFIRRHDNFVNALQIRPHVTIAKHAPVPELGLQMKAIDFSMMPVAYSS